MASYATCLFSTLVVKTSRNVKIWEMQWQHLRALTQHIVGKMYLNGQQQSGNVSRLDLHRDVKVQSNPEPLEGVEVASPGAEEVAGLNLLRAGNDAGLVVLAPLADLAVPQPELPEAADESGWHFLEIKMTGYVSRDQCRKSVSIWVIRNLFLIYICYFQTHRCETISI